jgi:hypothetical protein
MRVRISHTVIIIITPAPPPPSSGTYQSPCRNPDVCCGNLWCLRRFDTPGVVFRIRATVRLHCKENLIYVFLFWELRGLSPNSHTHVSVSNLYTPKIGPHISLQLNRQINPRHIEISHRYMSVGTGKFCFGNTSFISRNT